MRPPALVGGPTQTSWCLLVPCAPLTGFIVVSPKLIISVLLGVLLEFFCAKSDSNAGDSGKSPAFAQSWSRFLLDAGTHCCQHTHPQVLSLILARVTCTFQGEPSSPQPPAPPFLPPPPFIFFPSLPPPLYLQKRSAKPRRSTAQRRPFSR